PAGHRRDRESLRAAQIQDAAADVVSGTRAAPARTQLKRKGRACSKHRRHPEERAEGARLEGWPQAPELASILREASATAPRSLLRMTIVLLLDEDPVRQPRSAPRQLPSHIRAFPAPPC